VSGVALNASTVASVRPIEPPRGPSAADKTENSTPFAMLLDSNVPADTPAPVPDRSSPPKPECGKSTAPSDDQKAGDPSPIASQTSDTATTTDANSTADKVTGAVVGGLKATGKACTDKDEACVLKDDSDTTTPVNDGDGADQKTAAGAQTCTQPAIPLLVAAPAIAPITIQNDCASTQPTDTDKTATTPQTLPAPPTPFVATLNVQSPAADAVDPAKAVPETNPDGVADPVVQMAAPATHPELPKQIAAAFLAAHADDAKVPPADAKIVVPTPAATAPTAPTATIAPPTPTAAAAQIDGPVLADQTAAADPVDVTSATARLITIPVRIAPKTASPGKAATDVFGTAQPQGISLKDSDTKLASANANANPANPAHDQTDKGPGKPDETASPSAHHPAGETKLSVEQVFDFSSRSADSASIKPNADTTQPTTSSIPAPQILTAPASAAATPALAAATNGIALSALPIEIAARAKDGKNSFSIRLDPPELGRIDVRLDIDRTGHVTSRLMAERPDTLDLLRRDAPQIERALQDAGLKTSDNGLQFSLRDQSFANQPDDTPTAASLVVTQDESIPPAVIRQGYGQLLGLGSGIDIRV